jgi:hypothetical protein
MVYLRARPAVIEFVERWRETVANAKEKRIRDQAAFNMMTKLRRPEPLRVEGRTVQRLFECTNGADGTIKLGVLSESSPSLTNSSPALVPDDVAGVLPLSRFLNGHTFFVQHAHTLPAAKKPLSVHMTYQFAEGSKVCAPQPTEPETLPPNQGPCRQGLWFQ